MVLFINCIYTVGFLALHVGASVDSNIHISQDNESHPDTKIGTNTRENFNLTFEEKKEDTFIQGANFSETGKPIIETNIGIDYPYQEQLKLKPLNNNFLLSSFEFHLESNEFSLLKNNDNFDDYMHYTVFPKSISPILDLTNTKKLFLRFTHGLWDSEIWGSLPNKGFTAGGTGVEMWSLIEANDEETAFKQWKQLTNQLSGLFCASIDVIDSTKTTYPFNSEVFLEKNQDIMLIDPANSLFLMRGSLANEPICTENLTPFMKMLPTRGKSGISSLLDGHKVFDSYWSSMSLDVNTVCIKDSKICHNTMDINIANVVNVPKLIERNKNPIPKPTKSENLRCDTNKKFDAYECFVLPDSKDIAFHLSEIFGKTINGYNQLSKSSLSKIYVEDIDTDHWSCAVKKNEGYFTTDSNMFELNDQDVYDLYLSTDDSSKLANFKKAPLLVSRALTGYSQDQGGLRITFTNPSTEKDIDVIYYETLPWFMRLYLSSLKLEITDSRYTTSDILKSTHFVPAIDRETPLHLEYSLTLPKNSTVTMFFQFDKPLLKYEEYPPDANHGFEIDSALVVLLEENGDNYYLRTPTLLLTLSTPDFSMPYNVIILTSTVMALCFGTLYSLLTKKFVTVEKAKELAKQSKIQILLNKVKNLKKRN